MEKEIGGVTYSFKEDISAWDAAELDIISFIMPVLELQEMKPENVITEEDSEELKAEKTVRIQTQAKIADEAMGTLALSREYKDKTTKLVSHMLINPALDLEGIWKLPEKTVVVMRNICLPVYINNYFAVMAELQKKS